jgi:hypothetical protein
MYVEDLIAEEDAVVTITTLRARTSQRRGEERLETRSGTF